ncbi:MAG: SycD/LcrH family type III secretion system chaperone [Chlamydiota bacterium]
MVADKQEASSEASQEDINPAVEKLLDRILNGDLELSEEERQNLEASKIELSGTTLEDLGVSTGNAELDKLDLNQFNLQSGSDISKIAYNLVNLTVKKGFSPRDVLQCSDEMLENFYAYASTLLEGGKYEMAETVFQLLTYLDPTDYRYVLGQGVILHRQGKYEQAAYKYFVAAMLDQSQPQAHFYAVDCYLRLNDLVSALTALEDCLEVCGDNPEWEEIKDSVITTREIVQERLDNLPEGEKIEPHYAEGGFLHSSFAEADDQQDDTESKDIN